MRARLKSEIWDVWQCRSAQAVRPLWVLHITELVADELFLTLPEEPPVRINPGDWLVRADAPCRETDEDFQRDYEIVP